jgi:DNA processing protein
MISPAWFALNAATAWIGPVRFHRLLEAFSTPETVLRQSPAALTSAVPGLKLSQATALLEFTRTFDGQAEADAVKALGIQVLRFDQPGYPTALKRIPAPTPLLYVQGQLPADNETVVALVGTRKPSDYGLRMARQLAADLAAAGVWVVSGLALGIDTAAHAACVEAGGRSLGVQGRGLAGVYPAANKDLAARLLENGGVVSQFSLNAPPMKHHFPMRNAVLSGLCRGVVVVEGERDSGSLITADRALDQGREVFAVPGQADSPLAQGPLDLLEQGARLVRSAADILKELGLPAQAAPRRKRSVDLAQPALPGLAGVEVAQDSDEARILAVLRQRHVAGIDDLARESGLNASALSVALTQLELMGAVRQLPGARVELS